jgi:hypothetical protein
MPRAVIRIFIGIAIGGLAVRFVFVPLFWSVLLNFSPSEENHKSHSHNICINNLRQIDAAANQFALEHSLTNGDRISFPNDLTPYIKLNSAGKIPPCPSGGVYHISKVGEVPACSLGSTVTPNHILP